MEREFYSNGKLLLTGEYLILDGAKGLALPTKFGQSMVVRNSEKPGIAWQSIAHDGTVWFDAHFKNEQLAEKPITNPETVSDRLLMILQTAFEMKGGTEGVNAEIESKLDFPRDWGLGSSSTLICNIAKWLEIDPFALQEKTFGGSGYDIACGLHGHPLIFRLEYNNPVTYETDFYPAFADKMYFIHLNRKQDTRDAIKNYRSRHSADKAYRIIEIDEATQEFLDSETADDMILAINKHEEIMSGILNLPTLKTQHFADFTGGIKSLGAWGGDFFLAVSNDDPVNYFRSRGFETIIRYADMAK